MEIFIQRLGRSMDSQETIMPLTEYEQIELGDDILDALCQGRLDDAEKKLEGLDWGGWRKGDEKEIDGICSMWSLAGVMAPSVALARECSKGHEMNHVEHIENMDFNIVNQFCHSYSGHDTYLCGICGEEYYEPFSVTENHDMYWNDDMTALVCKCGYEEKAR